MDYKHFFLLLTFFASINIAVAQQSVEINTDSLIVSYNPCPTPTTANLWSIIGEADNYNSATDSVELIVFWGDGTSDTTMNQLYEGGVTDYFYSNGYTHSYPLAGTYNITIIANMPNAVSDTVSPSNSVIAAASCISVSGYTYEDLNNNCNIDATDDTLANHAIKILDGSSNLLSIDWSDQNGYYEMHIPSGLNNLSISVESWYAYSTVCPASGSYTFNSNASQTFDFALECASNTYDTWVFSNAFIALASDTGWVYSYPRARACDSTNFVFQDTFTLTIDTSILTYLGPYGNTPAPNVVNGNEITWYYNYSSYFHSNTYGTFGYGPYFHIRTITKTSVQLGDSACFNASISIGNNDINHWNNSKDYCREVNVAYDPNNKINLPSGVGPLGKVDTSTRTISYRINFQNTGTAPAQNIYILDTISEHFDLGSVRVLGTSHQPKFDFSYLGDRVVRFDFRRIFLPDSASDPEGSKGFIDLEIDLKPNLPIGTTIKNTAYIYFDWNPPIITNTAINTLYVEPDIEPVSLEFFTRDVTCKQNDNGLIDASVWTGTPPYSFLWSNGATTEDLENLAPGSYSVTVTDANGSTADYTVTIDENRVFDQPNVGLIMGERNPIGWSTYSYSIFQDVNSTYEWETVGGDLISTTTNTAEVLWKAGPDGQIIVTKTDPNGCAAQGSADVTIDLVGINEVNRQGIRIYPNPNDGVFTLEVTEISGSEVVSILDMQGRVLLHTPENSTQTSIDLSELGAGIYNVMVESDHATSVSRLVIK